MTGGAGYIGSHMLVELLREANEVCVCDNYSNSSPEALNRVRRLANADFSQLEIDIRDKDKLIRSLGQFRPDVVVHFAGLKAVGESNQKPLEYYDNNVTGSLNLLAAMDAAGCRRVVFSSSATVYGEPSYLPYDESHPLAPTNPYGRTKMMVENIVRDWCAVGADKSAALLRYFNPVGAHPSGDIGEDPNGTPNNLMPFVSQVAVGRRARVNVFGGDYPTLDGTGQRDYIHVVDLARAHLAAIGYVGVNLGCEVFNIGTGSAYSVLQIIKAFEIASQKEIPFEVIQRRQGDIATSVASIEKATRLLNWTATHTLVDICQSTWKWQSRNPRGYDNPS
ncbi:MAG: UDP-glucose 4-epimerase GalE [Novosphingobium sp.]|nr:UDP-glucose 4-epimerase GalE [Novosphingobium sp.]